MSRKPAAPAALNAPPQPRRLTSQRSLNDGDASVGDDSRSDAGRSQSGNVGLTRQGSRMLRELAESTPMIPVENALLAALGANDRIERVLEARNPHAPDNVVRFDFGEGAFRASAAAIEQTQIHFHMETKIYKNDSDEANRQKNAALGLPAQPPQDARPGGAAATGSPQARPTTTASTGAGPDDDEEENTKTIEPQRLRNQFNFSERASQTFNNPIRERGTNTEPPPRAAYGGLVTQHAIYKSYLLDLERQRVAKEKAKARGKEEEKKPVLPQTEVVTESSILNSESLKRSLKVMERMINLNTYKTIAHDYKYLEFPLDFVPDNSKGTLMPLWKFEYTQAKSRQVTALAWNTTYKDLFAVAYGSYDFKKPRSGRVCCFSLKNPSFPEYALQTESGVLCLDFHPQQPFLLAVGLYDGTVMVFDVKAGSQPVFKSTTRTGKHTDPVWQVRWQEDDLAQKHNFFSVSTDGRVTAWTMVKNDLRHTDIIRLRLLDAPKAVTEGEDEQLFGFAGGLCFDFSKFSEHLFVVGTEEGKIHKCSKAYNSQYLETYLGHNMAVYKVVWNNFHPDVFLSCSADWTVKLWNHNLATPILSFDLGNSVGDVCWAPYSSTVFAACTADGKIFVYDLSVDKHEPLCEQKVGRKVQLTHLAFNGDPDSYTLLAGDDHGTVQSFRLSPNLRKVAPIEEEKPTSLLALGAAADGAKTDAAGAGAGAAAAADPTKVDADGKAPAPKIKTRKEVEQEKLQRILVTVERSVITGM